MTGKNKNITTKINLKINNHTLVVKYYLSALIASQFTVKLSWQRSLLVISLKQCWTLFCTNSEQRFRIYKLHSFPDLMWNSTQCEFILHDFVLQWRGMDISNVIRINLGIVKFISSLKSWIRNCISYKMNFPGSLGWWKFKFVAESVWGHWLIWSESFHRQQ